MNDRILELSTRPAHVSIDNGLLTVELRDPDQKIQIPPGDLAAVVAAHYAITFTREAVAQLADAGAQLVVCDKHGMPAAMLLPLRGFHQPATRLALQAALPRPRRKRLWRQLVRSKIASQAALLAAAGLDHAGLAALIPTVRSGDITNVEGHAARLYWPALFGPDFRRDPDGFDHNRFLNYGYGVLRAVTCRAICAVGLHPGLGLQHHHRANPFCLADDLMEPFRPLVDRLVLDLHRRGLALGELTPDIKKELLGVLALRLRLGDADRVLFDVLAKVAGSLAAVIENRRRRLIVPDWNIATEKA